MEDCLIWDNEEKTILRQVYTGKITPEDVLRVASKTHDLLMTVPHKVHLIIDVSKARSTHQSFVKAARELDKKVAPNQGVVVVVDDAIASKLTLQSMKLVATESTRNTWNVKTVEEAHKLIAHYMDQARQ